MNPLTSENSILIVEDESTQRIILKKLLQRFDLNPVEATDGKDGLQIFVNTPSIRLVITDLEMPVMNGYELIRQIRNQEIRYTYIIVLSSKEDHEAVIKALQEGADDYIKKPVHPEELRLRIQSGLRMLKLENMEELIFSFAALSETRSKETGMHLKRIQKYTELICHYLSNRFPHLNLSKSYIKTISEASILHDIGKVGIPDAILNKPGKLTPEEFEIMKTHSTIGGEILQQIHQRTNSIYMEIAYQIAMYHHERWNGKGYPSGLKGDQIPLPARITALADVFDALVSTRIYKPAFSFNETKSIINSEEGEQFDPIVIAAFKANYETFAQYTEKYKDG